MRSNHELGLDRGSHDFYRYIKRYPGAAPTLSQKYSPPLPFPEDKPRASRMANIDATTPSLRLVQKLSNAYASLDIAQVDALMSKNFTYKTFPQSHELPDETKDGFAKKYGGILALLEKVEVRVQRRKPPATLWAYIYLP